MFQANEREYRNTRSKRAGDGFTVMHGEDRVASLSSRGVCRIYRKRQMPFDLYLEETKGGNIDLQIQNLDNFYHWCASRVLTLDRKYAKEILNSIGATQSATDRDRAEISLSYHCLSLTDIYWVRKNYEKTYFHDINLYENHLDTAFVDVALRGKQMTIQNRHLIADDLGTMGLFPKAWVRKDETFVLYKDGDGRAVESELLASKICRCFRANQVLYEKEIYDGQIVSASRMITSLERSIVSWENLAVYLLNHDIDPMKYLLKLDGYHYYMMNILDYLIGNTDRHWGNWGVLVDNQANRPLRLYDLMDFNKAFGEYRDIEGALCLPERDLTGRVVSQREAAVAAVKKVGLNQISSVSRDWFTDSQQSSMFFRRLQELQDTCREGGASKKQENP